MQQQRSVHRSNGDLDELRARGSGAARGELVAQGQELTALAGSGPPAGAPRALRTSDLVKLQRLIGNRAIAGELSHPLQIGRQTADGTDYTNEEKRNAIAAAKASVTKKKAKDTDYASAMADYLIGSCGGLATNFKTKVVLERSCKDWWNKPSLVDEPKVIGPARVALVDPTIEYGAEHGDLHFIGDPTDKKSAWDLDKGTALALMEAEIRSHLGPLGPLGPHSGHENRDGWAPFYITAQYSGPVGRYKGPKVKNKYPSTDHFTIQLQVNYNANMISYHGFPDERIEGKALGLSINKTDSAKLT